MSWLLGGPQNELNIMKKVVSQLSQPALQALQSDGFRKDILEFSKIGDECITLSACDLQKLISFFNFQNHLFECIYDLAYFF